MLGTRAFCGKVSKKSLDTASPRLSVKGSMIKYLIHGLESSFKASLGVKRHAFPCRQAYSMSDYISISVSISPLKDLTSDVNAWLSFRTAV